MAKLFHVVSLDEAYQELIKARKKPYGHVEYVRRTKGGKLITIPQKGVKPMEAKGRGIKEFRDGLDLDTVRDKYPWVLKAKIENAILGENDRGLIWYDGTWKDGTWKWGIWLDGTWENGTWKNGAWFNGTWKDGTWKDGRWEYGIWKGGTWKNGEWWNGKWYGGYDSKGKYHKDNPDKWQRKK